MESATEKSLEKRLKRQIIGKPHRFEAIAPLGFEQTLVEELKYIGIQTSDAEENCATSNTQNAACSSGKNCSAGIKVAGDGKVEFTAKITEAWKAVAYSRIANRILMEIGSFKAENFGQLEKHVAEVPWELYFSGKDFAEGSVLHVTCKHSRLYHSDAVKERIQKVIQNHKDIKPAKVTEPTEVPQHLYVSLVDDRCTLWLDFAGEELYKRGHERFVAEAPLKETIAAAMIFEASKIAGAEQDEVAKPPVTIVDAMAGSGTFSLEAAYIANGLIPGKCRDFALKHQPAFKEASWNFILKQSGASKDSCNKVILNSVQEQQSRSGTSSGDNVAIITSDISQRPIDIIKHNAEVSPLPAGVINPQLKDFFSYTITDFIKTAESNCVPIILLNPPYGKRLDFDAPKLYTKIGQKLASWSHDAQSRNINLIVAILAPKECTQNLLQACPTLDPRKNTSVKSIETSHGGFSLNAIFAKI